MPLFRTLTTVTRIPTAEPRNRRNARTESGVQLFSCLLGTALSLTLGRVDHEPVPPSLQTFRGAEHNYAQVQFQLCLYIHIHCEGLRHKIER